jgi:hypothetical protein
MEKLTQLGETQPVESDKIATVYFSTNRFGLDKSQFCIGLLVKSSTGFKDAG